LEVSWSRESPTRPGHYLRRDDDGRVGVAHVIYVRGGLDAVVAGDLRVGLEGAEWYGPLPKPERWTSKRPRKPGFYWIKGRHLLACVMEVRKATLPDCMYAGPIEVPD